MRRWRIAPLLPSGLAEQETSPSVSSHSLIESFPRAPLSLSNTSRPLGFFRRLSAVPFPRTSDYTSHESDYEEPESTREVSIQVKAYFLCTSVDLRRLHAENIKNVLPHTCRSSNYIALKYSAFPSLITVVRISTQSTKYLQYPGCLQRDIPVDKMSFDFLMPQFLKILCQLNYGDIETFLTIVKRHATRLLRQMWKDGGPDYILLKNLDMDGVHIIGSVLGQSIALDYFVSQFAYINRKLESSITFTMDRKKLLQLVGKANSNLDDVILKVGLFERSEIAWVETKYAQIYEYLREEYEVTQQFGNLNFKLKFVESDQLILKFTGARSLVIFMWKHDGMQYVEAWCWKSATLGQHSFSS